MSQFSPFHSSQQESSEKADRVAIFWGLWVGRVGEVVKNTKAFFFCDFAQRMNNK